MKTESVVKWGRLIILVTLVLNGVIYAYQLIRGTSESSKVLPSFFVVLVLILLFLVQSKKTYLYFQGILAIGVMMEFAMFLTLIVGIVIALGHSEHGCFYKENLVLLLSLISSLGWKVILMILGFKYPQLI